MKALADQRVGLDDAGIVVPEQLIIMWCPATLQCSRKRRVE